MKVCKCPRCRVVHEAVPASTLVGLSEELVYRRTHCCLCESPSSEFVPLPDERDLMDDEFGYPMAVVRWL